jgi:hypothetical protein
MPDGAFFAMPLQYPEEKIPAFLQRLAQLALCRLRIIANSNIRAIAFL